MPLDNDILETLEIETGPTPSFSVIWLHGLGADGHDFEPIVAELRLPETVAVRFVFPHAPYRPVTINGGYVMRAWYDIFPASDGFESDAEDIRVSQALLEQLIEQEIERGIAADRILLAGFSQGGAIALHTGLRYDRPLAGIMALSTYLPLAETLPAELNAANRRVPVFMAHGNQDPIVALHWAEASRDQLQAHGLVVEWHLYPMAHSVHPQEIQDISAWLGAIIDR